MRRLLILLLLASTNSFLIPPVARSTYRRQTLQASYKSLSSPALPEEEAQLLQNVARHNALKECEKHLALFGHVDGGAVSGLKLVQELGLVGGLEEIDLIRANGISSRNVLVSKSLRLVSYVVTDVLKRRRVNSLDRTDLISEGSIGLMRAIDKYVASEP